MSTRRKSSGGQALVLITLALTAMAGLMGLAVDLGWSFFVQRQAQGAADAAALGAVQEAFRRLNGTPAGFTCASAPPTTNTDVYCTQPAAPLGCDSFGGSSNSNLFHGCLYAQQNGFTDGGMNGRQKVTIEAGDAPLAINPLSLNPKPPTTAPGVNDVAYWVTVRTVQTVPQLFSAVLKNTEGVVSAGSTAGIVSVIVPGSFYAMNRRGDCITDPGGKGGPNYLCGVDLRSQGSGSKPCPGGAVTATVCAGSGIFLSSDCDAGGPVSNAGCADSGGPQASGNNYAGMTGGGARVWSRSTLTRVPNVVSNPADWVPQPVVAPNPSVFRDPMESKPQPPLLLPSGGNWLRTCGIPNGQITTVDGSPLILGPYQYYNYDFGDVTHNPNGRPIEITGNGVVQFRSTGGCFSAPFVAGWTDGTGTTPPNPQLPGYVFWGGLQINQNSNKGITDFGAGQYAMVGVNGVDVPAFALQGGNGTVVGDTSAGTQFITTAPGYPGLAGQLTGLNNDIDLQNLVHGHVDVKTGNSGSVTLTGLRKDFLDLNAPSMASYANSVLWQDRRNSNVIFDQTPDYHTLAGSTAGSYETCAAQGFCTGANDRLVVGEPLTAGSAALAATLAGNRVTATSPKFNYASTANVILTGYVYQPRGAWFQLTGGGDMNSPTMVVTGMVYTQGSGRVSLMPTTAPAIRFVVALIQ
jgi:hypothetical protein